MYRHISVKNQIVELYHEEPKADCGHVGMLAIGLVLLVVALAVGVMQ